MTEQQIADLVEAFLPPYARELGIGLNHIEHGAPVLALEFGERVEGRPGYLHGGSTSGLLEIAGYAALRAHLASEGREERAKPVNITVQFLRGAGSQTTFARGRVTRAGGRTSNVDVEAWQGNRAKPVATAVLNFLLVDPA